MLSYRVRCEFTESAAAEVADRWISWLREEHIGDVLNAGARSADIFRIDHDTLLVYEIRYRFPDRAAFDRYLANDAPQLRDEGLRHFPLSLGLSYSRTVGELIER